MPYNDWDMAAFFQHKRSTLCGVIVDIGSGSLAASIVLSNRAQKLPEILYTYREFMPIKSTNTPVAHARAMRHALFSAMSALEQKGMRVLQKHSRSMRVKRILVSCTAPWSEVATQILHFAQDTPFVVTRRMIDEMILHAYSTEGEYAKILEDAGRHIVEKAIINTALNGYSVHDPYGKEASEIAVAYLRGLVSTPILTALEYVKKQIRADIDVRVHTTALILYCALRDLYPNTIHALIVNISGEATELSLMQDNILYESVVAPYGMNSLIRDVAESCKTIPEEARGYLRAYKQNALTKAQERALAEGQKRFTSSLETALVELTARYVLPRTIFLILDQNMEPFFTDMIQKALNGKGGHTEKTIISFSPESAHALTVVASGIAVDPRLAMAARFFHKLHACGEIDRLEDTYQQ